MLCASRSYLPTGATIVSVGGSSLVAGTVIAFASECGGFLCSYMTDLMRSWIENRSSSTCSGHSLTTLGPLLLFGVVAGGVLGLVSNWGSEHGYYHTVMLPLIALEMQRGSFALLVIWFFVKKKTIFRVNKYISVLIVHMMIGRL